MRFRCGGVFNDVSLRAFSTASITPLPQGAGPQRLQNVWTSCLRTDGMIILFGDQTMTGIF